MTSWRAVLVAISLLCVAPNPRANAAKRKKPAPAAGAAVTKEKRVTGVSPARTRPTLSPSRSDAAGTSTNRSANDGLGDGPAVAAATSPLGGDAAASGTTTKAAKTKVYTFGAMDVEGKLKTPQLLYFLNRVKLELDMSAPDHRSFMKELEKTAEDPNL